MTDIRRAFPVFENPFLLPYAVFGECGIDRLRSAPRLQNLLFTHSHHDTVLLDVLLKVRIAKLDDHRPYHRHEDKYPKPGINDDPDRAATNKRRLIGGGIESEALRFNGHGVQGKEMLTARPIRGQGMAGNGE